MANAIKSLFHNGNYKAWLGIIGGLLLAFFVVVTNVISKAQEFVIHELRPYEERLTQVEEDAEKNERSIGENEDAISDMAKILYRIEGKVDSIDKKIE